MEIEYLKLIFIWLCIPLLFARDPKIYWKKKKQSVTVYQLYPYKALMIGWGRNTTFFLLFYGLCIVLVALSCLVSENQIIFLKKVLLLSEGARFLKWR